MAFAIFASFRGYVLASILLTTAVFSHAIYMKRLFYRSVVFLAKSKFAILAVGNMALVTFLLLWRLVQTIFLGPLRFRELERLHIRARDAIIECCFALTIFREDFNLKFVVLVTTLLLLKSLHWLTKDRIEYLEEQPLSPLRAHLRLVGLMLFLFFVDTLLVVECVGTTYRTSGRTMFVLFAFEFTVLVIELSSDFVRYIFHVVDLYMEGRWEGKGLYSFYNELLSDMCQLTVYILFFMYVQLNYTFPIHIIRELYMTFHKFQRRCSDFIRYRRVMATMNDLFADATEEELAEGDRTCIICREEMTAAKKLSCGHMFHARCLQSWLKRQLSCPTCRAAVDVSSGDNQPVAPAAQNEPPNQRPNAENNDANPPDNPDPANNAAPVAGDANAAARPAENEVNAAQGGARLINFANHWWDQVMYAAGANPPNGAARDPQGNARPAINAAEEAQHRMNFRDPNALAHMQLRARRRGAWQPPYQPYQQVPQQPYFPNFVQEQQQGFAHANQNFQAVRQGPGANGQNGAGTQTGNPETQRPQTTPGSASDHAAQSGGTQASSSRRNRTETDEIERATASAMNQWEQLQRTAHTTATIASASEDAVSDQNREESQVSPDQLERNQHLSLPLEKLLAIQEQIEILRGEVQELVLLATSSPQEAAASSSEVPSDNLESAIHSGHASGSVAADHENEEVENVGNPEDDETANLRRRRIEFLERRAHRNKS